MTRGGKILLVVAASVVVVLVLLGIGWQAAIGGFAPNIAEESADPLGRAIVAAGGTKVCDGGYNGLAPWNDRPWYQVFYEIEDSPDLAATITNAAAREGYILTEPPPAERAFAPPSEEFRNSAANPSVEVVVMRGDQAASGCDSGTRQQEAASGNAVIALMLIYIDVP